MRTKLLYVFFSALVFTASESTKVIGDKYNLFYENRSYNYALYEPTDGCYLGIDITTGRRVPLKIREFENSVGKRHGIYTKAMRIDEPLPIEWVLECVTEMRTPCIIVEPPSEYSQSKDIKDAEKYLEALADSLGEYYTPMFVQLLPASVAYDTDEYVELFRKAHAIFKERASNVALVFTLNGYDVLDLLPYYPGNDFVDWVGLNIFNVFEKDKEYGYDAVKALELFYFNFQRDKPLMISQLAISHYSSIDHVYRTSYAMSEIDRIYQAVENYPRIKCIIYKDFNGVGISGYQDNCSVLDNPDIKMVYKKNIVNPSFISEINLTSASRTGTFQNPEPIQSAYPAYQIEYEYYLSENALRYDLNIIGASAYGNEIIIDGVRYYKADILKNTSRKYQIDSRKKRVTITGS